MTHSQLEVAIWICRQRSRPRMCRLQLGVPNLRVQPTTVSAAAFISCRIVPHWEELMPFGVAMLCGAAVCLLALRTRCGVAMLCGAVMHCGGVAAWAASTLSGAATLCGEIAQAMRLNRSQWT